MRSQSYASSSSRAASSGSTFFETLLDSTHLHVNQQNGPELLCISITQRQIRSLSFDISPQGTDISTRPSPFVGCIVLSRVVKDEFRFLVAFIAHCRSNFTSDSSGSLTFFAKLQSQAFPPPSQEEKKILLLQVPSRNLLEESLPPRNFEKISSNPRSFAFFAQEEQSQYLVERKIKKIGE